MNPIESISVPPFAGAATVSSSNGGGGVYQNTNGMPLADGRTLHMDLQSGDGNKCSDLI